MAFGSAFTDRKSKGSTERSESPFLKTEAGVDVVIRILDEDVTPFYRYWLDVNVGNDRKEGRPVIVGYDNPIKDFMNALGEGHPKFRRPARRAYLNVLDRTEPTPGNPLNKVKILELGPSLIQRLQVLDGRAMSRTDFHKMNLQEFDILLVTIGAGKEKDIVPSQHIDDLPLPKELAELPRFDVRKMAQPMPNDAVKALLEGADYGEVRKSLGWEGNYPMLDPTLPF